MTDSSISGLDAKDLARAALIEAKEAISRAISRVHYLDGAKWDITCAVDTAHEEIETALRILDAPPPTPRESTELERVTIKAFAPKIADSITRRASFCAILTKKAP